MTDRDTVREFARSAGLEVITDGLDDLIRSGGTAIRVAYTAGDKAAEVFFNGIVVADDMRIHNIEVLKSWISALSSRLATRS